ncbi:MAG: DNA repair protein RecO [Paracoccaceae bacterium]|nr:DNA repair protein RecO [Paracoccaceae bacterium]
MEWRDDGVTLSRRRHGDTGAIVEVLTRDHGRHAGFVHGGASSKLAPVLETGTQVEVAWRSRVEEQLGIFKVEMVRSRSRILADPCALSALGSVAALVRMACPERMPLPRLYHATVSFLDHLESGESARNGFASYALWEKQLLEDLGYGMDLRCCAVTGTTVDLVHVSPRTGRAVSRAAGARYADRLLPLPPLLLGCSDETTSAGVLDALTTTGHFIETRLLAVLGDRPVPHARRRLITQLRRRSGSGADERLTGKGGSQPSG